MTLAARFALSSIAKPGDGRRFRAIGNFESQI
jgi:hypothetical protein